MTPQDFCFWLQGALELTSTNSFNEQQVAIIKEHLSLVFNKETKISLTSADIPETSAVIDNMVKKMVKPNFADGIICTTAIGTRYC